MARGPKSSLVVSLSTEDRNDLQAMQRSTTIRAGLAKRARIILEIGDRKSVSDIARSVGISRRLIYQWVQRFLDEGIGGLSDKPRSGRPPVFPPRSRRSCGQARLRAAG